MKQDKDFEQRIAAKEEELARLKARRRKEADGAKYVIGGMMIAVALQPNQNGVRDFLIKRLLQEEGQNLEPKLRPIDLKRTASLLRQLLDVKAKHP